MDDIEDGVQYVIKQGWVDKDRWLFTELVMEDMQRLWDLCKTPDLYTVG
jgi:hypothetical protein